MAGTPVYRRPWFTAALAAALILAAAVVAVDAVRVVDYEEQVLVDLTWEQAHGLRPFRGQDGRLYGPSGFAVDGEGRILLADRRGERLLLFSAAGDFEREVPLPEGTAPVDVAVPGDGGAYVLDASGHRLLVVNSDGEARRELDIRALLDGSEGAGFPPTAVPAGTDGSGQEIWLLEALVRGLDGRIYVMLSRVDRQRYESHLLRAESDGAARHLLRLTLERGGGVTARPEDLMSFPVGSFAVDGRGRLVSVSPDGPFSQIVRYHEPRGAVRDRFEFRRDRALARTEIIGLDDAGRLYLSTGTGTETGRIYRLSPAGEVELDKPVPWDSRWGARRHAQVRPNGDIYVMVPSEAGLELRRWQSLSRWEIRWRQGNS